MSIADIDHVVILTLENRSFDQMLGYLNLNGPNRIAVEGLRDSPDWRRAVANIHAGQAIEPRRLAPGQQYVVDPPHGLEATRLQIDTPAQAGPQSKMGEIGRAHV